MAGTKNSGRRSLKEEIGVLDRLSALTPKAFALIQKRLDSGDEAAQDFALEWLKPLLAKAIPQKIGGDPDNPSPVPIYGNISVQLNGNLQGHNGNTKDILPNQTDTSGSRWDSGK